MKAQTLIAGILAFGPIPLAGRQLARSSEEPAALSLAATEAAAPVMIDGRADDTAWLDAQLISEFRQVEPLEGADPSLPTEFRVAYDQANLYVFVRAHDSEPDSILRVLARRDTSSPSDEILVVVDSYHDRRTGFEFAVNPDGVRRDSAIYDDDRRDDSWDPVWEVATAIDDGGWSAEFRIPFSQLRYPDAAVHTFGLGVFRRVQRYTERVSWPGISRDRPGLVSQLGSLEGLVGLGNTRTLELTPYVVTKSETRGGSSDGYVQDEELTGGADVKLRLTPNVTLDATVNPDFGQVESDPAVLSLDAFEVFVDERRAFFIEGAGLYRFQLNCYIVVDCSTNEGLFYSRRIGRTPGLAAQYGDRSSPRSTPIAAAAKLTGRTNGGLSFGLMNAVARRVGGVDRTTVEPRTNHAILSAQQDFQEGEAGLRVVATAVNRSLDTWTAPELHASAYAGALSFRQRFLEGNYEVSGLIAASQVAGSAEAMEQTQRGAVHYYQQPGDDPRLDPARTTLSGHSEQLKIGKYGGGITRIESSFVRHSSGFEVNDLGFLKRADLQEWSTWAALRFNDPNNLYLWFQLNGSVWRTWNTSGDLIQSALNMNAHMGFHNNWNLHGGITVGGLNGAFCDRCTRGGPLLRHSRGYRSWFGVNADDRKVLVPSMWVNLFFGDDGRTHWASIEPSLTFRPSTQLEVRFGATYRDNQEATQWVGNFGGGADGVHHTFAHLDQRTVSANLRVNYTASRDLTIEFYGEPFTSTGTYSDFRELSATPAARQYDDRFTLYSPPESLGSGFHFRQLRTNLVVRWEYLPGSTVFLVWAHGREANSGHPSGTSWNEEMLDLLDLHPDNTFLIKVAHWLNW